MAPQSPLPRWWPQFKRPKTVLLTIRPANPDDSITLMTLSGLAARATNVGRGSEMIWVKQDSSSAYDLWLAAMLKQTGAKLIGPFTVPQLVARFTRAGIVKGYIVYRPDTGRRDIHQGVPNDTSSNVATSLCGPLHAIAVSENREESFRSSGMKKLLDARWISEADCFENYKNLFNRDIVALQDPRVAETRDEAVATNAIVLCMPDALFDRVLAWAKPNTPVLGWGIGDEFEITSHATKQAHFMTDTDWCNNLPLLSTEKPGFDISENRLRRKGSRSIWDLSWQDNVHYATFIMSDGDNVQWAMGDFTQSTEKSWWDSSFRGQMPLGWTCCYDNLAQLSPYTAEYLFRTASMNDDFVLFGGGYFYPDLYGSTRPLDPGALTGHASDFSAYMKFGGVRLLMFNLLQWDSAAGVDAYRTFAKASPDLLGIFGISYSPYTAGRGNTFWVDGGQDGSTPVVSVRYALWNHASDRSQGDPVKVAGLINNMPHDGTLNSDRFFSATIVHAWSWFRAPHDGKPASEVDQSEGGKADTGRGAAAAVWCADLLQPHVRVVTPTDFMLLMRLRLHSKETLTYALKELASSAAHANVTELKREKAGTALRQADGFLKQSNYSAAFASGKRAYEVLKSAE